MRICLTIEGQENVSWQQWVALAETCESSGFEGLFRSDHYQPFRRLPLTGSMDAWATMTALAALTSRIRLGTVVSPIGFRHPAEIAKVVVTADHVSGGRVELGLGAGSFEEEHHAFGFPFPSAAERQSILEEYIEVVHRLWERSEATVTFEGTHFRLQDCRAIPKGVQDPHPRLLLGGSAGVRGAALAARWADEYNLYFLTPEEVGPKRERLRAACEAIGRDPATLSISLMLNTMIGADRREIDDRASRLQEKQRGGTLPFHVSGFGPEQLVGTPTEVVERLGRYADAGVERVMLQTLLHEDLDAIRLVGSDVIPEARKF